MDVLPWVKFHWDETLGLLGVADVMVSHFYMPALFGNPNTFEYPLTDFYRVALVVVGFVLLGIGIVVLGLICCCCSDCCHWVSIRARESLYWLRGPLMLLTAVCLVGLGGFFLPLLYQAENTDGFNRISQAADSFRSINTNINSTAHNLNLSVPEQGRDWLTVSSSWDSALDEGERMFNIWMLVQLGTAAGAGVIIISFLICSACVMCRTTRCPRLTFLVGFFTLGTVFLVASIVFFPTALLGGSLCSTWNTTTHHFINEGENAAVEYYMTCTTGENPFSVFATELSRNISYLSSLPNRTSAQNRTLELSIELYANVSFYVDCNGTNLPLINILEDSHTAFCVRGVTDVGLILLLWIAFALLLCFILCASFKIDCICVANARAVRYTSINAEELDEIDEQSRLLTRKRLTKYEDVTVVLDDGVAKAVKYILERYSEYFVEKFNAFVPIKAWEEVDSYRVPGVKMACWKEVYEWMNEKEFTEKPSLEMLLDLVTAAKLLKIKGLAKRCCKILIPQIKNLKEQDAARSIVCARRAVYSKAFHRREQVAIVTWFTNLVNHIRPLVRGKDQNGWLLAQGITDLEGKEPEKLTALIFGAGTYDHELAKRESWQ